MEYTLSPKQIVRNTQKQSRKNKNSIPLGITKELFDLLVSHKVVAFYASIMGEVDLSLLWEEVWRLGGISLLPKVISATEIKFCVFDKSTPLKKGAFGIVEPESDFFEGEIDLFFVPGLAFSEDGSRLGYGAGYYDRFLRSYPYSQKIGVCTSEEVLSYIPTEKHDILMDGILTEKNLLMISRL